MLLFRTGGVCPFAGFVYFATCALLFLIPRVSTAEEPKNWESEIAAFEARDKVDPPPKGAILFVGSSSIRLWGVAEAFPEFSVINRGFGGSHLIDSVRFARRIILPHEPSTIVLYAGDNDVASGKKSGEIERDFRALVEIVHAQLPKTRIVFISIKPSIARWELVSEMRDANSRIRELCQKDDRLAYVDVDSKMIGPDGKPRPDLFVDDGLHLNKEGYQLWNRLLREKLQSR